MRKKFVFEYYTMIDYLSGDCKIAYKNLGEYLPYISIKFIKSSRNKKCRGYFRKIHKALIVLIKSYSELDWMYNEYITNYIKDKSDKELYYNNTVKVLNKRTKNLFIDIVNKLINNKIRIKTKCIRSNEYRLIRYKFIIENEYFEYGIDLGSVDYILNKTDKGWKTYEKFYQY